LIVLVTAAAAQAGTLYVSPDGRAGAPGTIDRPLPSIAAARDAIRAARRAGAAGPETVLLRGGFYYLSETFLLTPQDSDVTYAAYAGERPILSGGRRIEGWKKGPGNMWSVPADRRSGNCSSTGAGRRAHGLPMMASIGSTAPVRRTSPSC
jgi:hypothetical protein